MLFKPREQKLREEERKARREIKKVKVMEKEAEQRLSEKKKEGMHYLRQGEKDLARVRFDEYKQSKSQLLKLNFYRAALDFFVSEVSLAKITTSATQRLKTISGLLKIDVSKTSTKKVMNQVKEVMESSGKVADTWIEGYKQNVKEADFADEHITEDPLFESWIVEVMEEGGVMPEVQENGALDLQKDSAKKIEEIERLFEEKKGKNG